MSEISGAMPEVRWAVIDQALEGFTSSSALQLLTAAVDSPRLAECRSHLLLLWVRVLRSPERNTGEQAQPEHLPGLLQSAVEAAPDLVTVAHREPSDARGLAGFNVAGVRLLVHPGELEQPMVMLRRLAMTAAAVDEAVLERFGFSLTDLLELSLRHSDRVLRTLAFAWTAPADTADGEVALGPREEVAAAEALSADMDELARACRHPGRAAQALAWLTAAAGPLVLRLGPDEPMLGAVLAVEAHGRRTPVPASVVLSTVTAAAERLLAEAEITAAHEQRLQQFAVERAGDLLGFLGVPVVPDTVEVASSPVLRVEIAVVSAVQPGELGPRLEQARARLLQATAGSGRGRLVLYAGPMVVRRELVEDTLLVHVEELAEMRADAGGDLSTLACFVLEMCEHPTVAAIASYDVLDTWAAWCTRGTLLPPGPPGEEIAVVPPWPGDPTWERAAAWARVDAVLAGAGLPESVDWHVARALELTAGGEVVHADLFAGRDLAALVSVGPAVAWTVTTGEHDGAVLDLETLVGLADGLRTTVATAPAVAEHFRLPDGQPLFIHLTEAAIPDDRAQRHPEADLVVDIGLDKAAGKVSIHLDAHLLTQFADAGSEGHRVLGLLFQQVLMEIRQARGAGAGTDSKAFSESWDAALPVLCLNAVDESWPATAAHDAVSDSPYLRARAQRTIADAVRAASVPAGAWSGRKSVQVAGQLLTILETTLAEQLAEFEPELVAVLARHLNGAWCTRARERRGVAGNLTRPWADNWTDEARRVEEHGAAVTAALQLLLQMTLAQAPCGKRPVDALAVAELVALADLTMQCALPAVAAVRHRLHDLTVEVDATGVFAFYDPETSDSEQAQHDRLDHAGFDRSAFQHALLQHRIDQARATVPEILDPAALFEANRRRTRNAFQRIPLPGGSHLAKADLLLKRHWGTGLDGLAAVLATAADWTADPDGLARTTEEALAGEASAWSGLPTDEVRAALAVLTIGPHNAADEREHFYTEVERRTRFTTQPLIGNGRSGIWILPWLVHASRHIYASFLVDSRLPHPYLPKDAAEELRHHRQQLSRQLEEDVTSVARRANLPHLPNLIEKRAEQLGIPGLGGEIDLLVADPVNRRLWVIEAKHLEGALSSTALREHLRKFTAASKGHLDRLLAKIATVQVHTAAAARALGVQLDAAATGDWRVLGLVVTRGVEPTAFLPQPAVAFTLLDHLACVLTDPADPAPGWVRPPDAASFH